MLSQNYPNPFNPSTSISFNLPKNGKARLDIYNTKGELVKTLLNQPLVKGKHSLTWDGTNSSDARVASGLYFYRLTSGNRTETAKMMLLK